MSAQHDAAQRLAELGYRVFPCGAGGKMPATPHGCLDGTTDADRIDQWWGANPNYNVGLCCDTLLVVDIDVGRDGHPNGWLKTLSESQVDELAKAPCAITPRGGQHLVFRQEHGLRNTASKIADRVDTRADGGYILVAPSRTENGGYQWVPGRELDIGRDRLPDVPVWLLDMLAQNATPVRPLGETLNDGQEVWPEGSRNSRLTSVAGYMRRGGSSEAVILAALLELNREKCQPKLPEDEVRRIAKSVSRYEPDQTTQSVAEGHADEIFGKPVDESTLPPEKPYNPFPDPGAFPSHLLNVPGLINEVMTHNLETSHKRQPELALAAAVCLMSAITGQKVEDERRTRTNIYVMGMCDSGGGKNHGRQLNKELLDAAGMVKWIGSEKISSPQGIITSLDVHPVRLMQIDEFGGWLEGAADFRSGQWVQKSIDELMILYGEARSVYVSAAVSEASRVKAIKQPHLVIYGTSVPHRVWDALTLKNTDDGFLGRTVLIEATDHNPPEQTVVHSDPPERIIEQVKWWGNYNPGGNLGEHGHPKPRRMVTSGDALTLYDELRAEIEGIVSVWPDMKGVFKRCGENARKLAMIYTLSGDCEAQDIGPEAVSWGCQIVLHSAKRLAHMAEQLVARNGYERIYKRVLRVIRDAGGVCRKTDILRGMTDTPVAQLNEVLGRMVDSNVIDQRQIKLKTKPAWVYSLTHPDNGV